MSAYTVNKELTKEKLWQGLLDDINEHEKESNRNGIAIRPIIDLLFGSSLTESGYENVSFVELANDPFTLGYIFSLQESKPFVYMWSCMREKLDTYVEYLQNFQHYLNFVVNDINDIIRNLAIWNHVTLIVDGVFSIRLSEDAPYFKFELCEKGDIMGLLKIDRSRYSLRVKMGPSTVAVFDRFEKDTPKGIAESIDKFIVSAGIEKS
jgi:hypothetical protein